ncbi:hypothetical protein BDQ12DRAFT_731054 [Crucibulum laeve]|uniref:F-box domain-containing protein n=1 Tax=Crucibulum laeve TaxID=68775 RepID=A0A5C3ML96_9AGAR|nr:hypothetical protein BDQ12DRAFT_731054 [Crucibulum laeve]
MNSDDENGVEPDDLFFSRSRPYLQLYEEDERSLWLQERAHAREAAEAGKVRPHNDNWRTYRVLRFFDTVKGFYKGKLDLSGRHQQRWDALHRRWVRFVEDYQELKPYFRKTEKMVWWPHRKRQVKEVIYEIDDLEPWEKFQECWHIPEMIGYEGICNHMDDMLEYVTTDQQPRLQSLCLTDFPPEILDHIFRHATIDQARLLSATCHQLNEIGKRYIYYASSFLERLILHLLILHLLILRLTVKGYFLQHSTQEDLMRTIDFLTSRLDLLDKVERLFMSNQWNSHMLDGGLEEFDFESIEIGFSLSLSQAFNRVLSGCINVTNLRLVHLDITEEVVRNICNLEQLDILHFSSCHISEDVSHALETGRLPVSHVENLHLMFDDSTEEYLWHTLIFCPDLLTLSIHHFGKLGFDMAPERIWSKCRCFTSLERLFIGPLKSGEVLDLAQWLADAAHNAPLRITHFKLFSETPMHISPVTDLIHALQASPLQVLVLDGVQKDSPNLIGDIVTLFPNLISLTLFLRENRLQRNVLLYSGHTPLGNMHPNLLASTAYNILGVTSLMHLLENGFPDWKSADFNYENWERAYEGVYFEDDHCYAWPFAAQCPTLETFLNARGSSEAVCRISRLPGGTPYLEVDEHIFAWNPWNVRQWNPDRFGSGWPSITTKELEKAVDNLDVGETE